MRLGSFVLFVALGLRLLRLEDGEGRRRSVNRLLAYVLAINGLAGFTQWDNWPFTSHIIAVGRPRLETPICMTEFRGVDALGNETRIDPYSWSQVYDSILQYWFEQSFHRLSAEEQGRVLGFLLAKAETARERLVSGERIGYERLLGRAASPYWLLLPRSGAAPHEPYRALRVYRVCWTPQERLRDPGSGRETLEAAYP